MTSVDWKRLYSNRLFLLVELTYLIIIPFCLVYFFPPLIHYGRAAFISGIAYVAIIMFLVGFKLPGLDTKNFMPSLRSLIAPTLIVILAMLVVHYLRPYSLVTSAISGDVRRFPSLHAVISYCLISVPAQEILFRSFLIRRIELVTKDKLVIIIITSFAFGFIHILAHNIYLTLGSFFLGISWSINFLKYNNLYTVMLSHALVGGLFIYFISTV